MGCVQTNNNSQEDGDDDNENAPIIVHVREDVHEEWEQSFEPFTVSVLYSQSISIGHLINKVMSSINKKHYPKIQHIKRIERSSFMSFNIYGKDYLWTRRDPEGIWKKLISQPITEYSRKEIEERGLYITVENLYEHHTTGNKINCKYINEFCDEKSSVIKCTIYDAMKNKEEYTEHNLAHLLEFVHFEDSYNEKPSCKHGVECKSFVRLESGGNSLNDRCHVQIYRHPPRNNRQIKLSDNMNELIVNKEWKECNNYLYEPTDEDDKIGLEALIDEVIRNGFKRDLCLNDEDYKNDEYSIMKIVDDKLNHIRHRQIGSPLNRAEMLSLILYTGCDCNYDLCSTQRAGNYMKWKWFDRTLHWAIRHLNKHEFGDYKIYSGLNNVKLNQNKLSGSFPTYISTSWSEDVAQVFVGGTGMLIQMDAEFRKSVLTYCCDVSWISKFPDECEILVARKADEFSLE
eukprot:10166_1